MAKTHIKEKLTFLTNLKEDGGDLRPPSPFDERAAEADSHHQPLVPENYFGSEALTRFWTMFQNHDTSFRSKRPRPASPRTTYLSRLRQLARCPEPLGVIRKCNSPRVDLNHYDIGNDLASAMGESIALIPGIDSLNLASNRISDQAASDVITNLGTSPTLGCLDLSNNMLNLHAATSLSALIAGSKTLVHINLEHNHLNNQAVALLCDALKKNQTVTRLNLSENQFSTPGMLAIATLLVENAKLEELYLSWNKIRGLGAQRLVEALGYHNSLRVLDLSWNSLNSCPNHSIATALATSLANNKVLVHLDLSNNSLDTKACTILAAALVGNHSIVGLHMVGNQAIVDARGFVRPQTTSIALQAQHKHCAIKHFELHQDNQESNNSTTLDAWWPYVDRACWLCGRWSEHRFAWTPSHKQDAKAKVKLHLCIDDWSGDEMHRSSDMFVLYRMLPPGKTKYFITVETEVAPGDVKRQYVVLKDKRTARLLRSHGDEPKFGTLQVVNYIAMTRYDGANPCHATLPRPGANTIKVLKWDIKKSVFASRYKESPSKAPIDTDALVAKAYAVDFKHTKVDRIVRDPDRRRELEAAGAIHYRAITHLYRKYCSRGVKVALDQVCVSLSGFNEFLDDCHLIDDTSERCTASDMDNVFVAANLEVTDEAKQQDNPDRSLTRFEFLECVFRIAINKYCNSKPVACESPAQALHRLMDENLTSMVPDDPNDFRTNYLYKEEISDCFLEYVVLLKELFAANSGQYCRVGEPRGMAIQEFIALMESFHVLNDKFKQRDLRDMFFASKMLLLDEMAPPEVQKKLLFFTDFLELLLRIAIVRYPPASPSVADAAVSLQTLFVRHICAKDKLVETFQHNADKVRVLGALSRFERRPSKKSVVQRKASNKQLQLPVPNQD
ncbi:hypothetical protein H310_08108 [Aphanomyces invadans]|uniref:Uncharacterized protein n=1 Tax=Aphanomyces invadans TaxID=157072 RepID=A0A024U1F8_9STRA|nr:hypothetical protein H310_08108 [Aphanomyces invadans]ETV99412.1 hypothetical protein H310_08108 [Aphanomyces invadans]|eukprot:XP_008871968.1 hypothetical protein H310_08108 [Aphanomyces invadans]